jgi:hypothetical protein
LTPTRTMFSRAGLRHFLSRKSGKIKKCSVIQLKRVFPYYLFIQEAFINLSSEVLYVKHSKYKSVASKRCDSLILVSVWPLKLKPSQQAYIVSPKPLKSNK